MPQATSINSAYKKTVGYRDLVNIFITPIKFFVGLDKCICSKRYVIFLFYFFELGFKLFLLFIGKKI